MTVTAPEHASPLAALDAAIEAAAAALNAQKANPLIARLDAAGLGHILSPDQIEAVVTLVSGLEGARALPQAQP